MNINVVTENKRRITAPVPLDNAKFAQLVGELAKACREGYELKNLHTLTGGHQRDPYVTGVVFHLERP